MDLATFYCEVLSVEIHWAHFLGTIGVISNRTVCKCCSSMIFRERRRRNRIFVVWRCTSRKCTTEHSVRHESHFLLYKRIDGKLRSSLSLSKILEIVYLFLNTNSTMKQLQETTSCSSATIVDWCSISRRVCTHVIESAPKFVGTCNNPIQIDESIFWGRRKHNRGRYLYDDRCWRGKNHIQCSRKNNYGDRVQGPWVLSIYQSSQIVRYIVVPDRSASTLIPFIKKNVAAGSGSLLMSGDHPILLLKNATSVRRFVTKNYVNPDTECHTQGAERSWVDAKAWLKRVRHPTHLIQFYLDELAWRKMRSRHSEGLITAFFQEVAIHFKSSSALRPS